MSVHKKSKKIRGKNIIAHVKLLHQKKNKKKKSSSDVIFMNLYKNEYVYMNFVNNNK